MSKEELVRALQEPGEHLILGGGSNVLFVADHLDRHVLHMDITGKEIVDELPGRVLVEFGAGENWHQSVLWSLEEEYTGLENLSLIPGTMGAAPIQNIGAYGVELQSCLHSVMALDLDTGEYIEIPASDMGLGYRQSHFKGKWKGKYIITEVYLWLYQESELSLSYGAIRQQLERDGIADPDARDVSNAVIAIRQSKLPDPAEIGNTGSFFKNPIIPRSHYDQLLSTYPDLPSYPVDEENCKVPAGWLIDRAGWKGYRRGDIGVHERQALVLVNYGEGTGADIYQLSSDIISDIVECYDIELEREVNLIF